MMTGIILELVQEKSLNRKNVGTLLANDGIKKKRN